MSNNEINASDVRRATGDGTLPWWHWHRHLYNWVIHWADTRFGMLALIVLAITEPICVPIPVDVMVIGLCFSKPKRSLRYGLTCALFSVLGGTIAFSLGMAIGLERFEHAMQAITTFLEWVSFGIVDLEDKVGIAIAKYKKYNEWAIAISALTPVPYMVFSWVGGAVENVSIVKFICISALFRTMRFGGESVLFYFLGLRARRLIEKYFNIATVVVIILLMVLAYAIKQLGHLFTG